MNAPMSNNNKNDQKYTFYTSRNTKGQAAVEYLMTYGWMLLAVAIIGGASFQSLGFQCVPTVTGFEGEQIGLDDFALNSEGELMLLVENTRREDAEIDTIQVSDTEGTGEAAIFQDLMLEAGTDEDFALTSNIQGSEECNEYDVEINYDVGPLDDVVSAGSFVAPLSAPEAPDQPSDVEAQ